MMTHLFAYGTLMCADILHQVAGVRPNHEPAVLTGYRRWSVTGEDYPAITVHRGGRVDGRLYLHLPAAAWARLDRFEGEMYVCRPVVVTLGDGRTRPAAAYVLKAAFRHRLGASEWDAEGFLRQGRMRFLATLTGRD